MGITIAVHSYKGGTGKTLISANLAALLAKRGKEVCLLDYDVRSPSLHVVLNKKPRLWLNDFLKGKCSLDAILHEIPIQDSKGRLRAGFANASTEETMFMNSTDENWEYKALQRIRGAKNEMFNDQGLDYLIFDTSPGVYYSSLNAIRSSDIVALVMKYDNLDIDGTKYLIRDIADALGKKSAVILNRIVCEGCGGPLPESETERVTTDIRDSLHREIIGVIPCLWELQLGGSRELYALTRPDHLFVSLLNGIADRISELSTR